ncbi:MAG TPA: hypothetical protein VH020_14330 [Stellaceae bacterium]|jgi:hypothetical protein|nr:hypothetical protein [Stellaceae bacterium]
MDQRPALARVPRGQFLAVGFLIAVVALALALALLDRPRLLINSDMLIPTDFVWDLLHNGAAWTGFQISRVPSFFPDLAIQFPVQGLGGSWRLAFAAFVFIDLLGLLGMGSWLASRIARADFAGAALCFVALAAIVVATGLATLPPPSADMGWATPFDFSGAFAPWLFAFMPDNHGGPFVLTLIAVALAAGTPMRPTWPRLAAIAALTWAAMLSDMLTLLDLLLPLTAALIGTWRRGGSAGGAAGRILAASWLGGVLGLACSDLLNRARVPIPFVPAIPQHLALFLADLGRYPELPAAIAVLAILLGLEFRATRAETPFRQFWFRFVGTGALLCLILTATFYEDLWGYRYGEPVLWWAVILLAARLAPAVGRTAARYRYLIPAGAAIVLIATAAAFHLPNLFTAHSPLVSCLRKANLRAGLANYWLSRETRALSDWGLQVEQIAANGAPFFWINDRFWYSHDRQDKAKPAGFQFIVMARLDANAVTRAYGPPDRVLACGPTTIRVFADPARLQAGLADR